MSRQPIMELSLFDLIYRQSLLEMKSGIVKKSGVNKPCWNQINKWPAVKNEITIHNIELHFKKNVLDYFTFEWLYYIFCLYLFIWLLHYALLINLIINTFGLHTLHWNAFISWEIPSCVFWRAAQWLKIGQLLRRPWSCRTVEPIWLPQKNYNY